LPEPEKNSEPSWFGFPLTLRQNKRFNRVDLISYLNANKIGTRLLFSGNLTKQPYMQNTNFRVHGELKNTDLVMDNTFWLGLYPGLTFKHLEFTINILKTFFR
jgi:CDP-6-deoxy-D-xylo-4-hexulose-3-dehydrase